MPSITVKRINSKNMTYIGAEYSEDMLFNELRERVKNENIRSFDAYSEMIDEIVEEKKGYGFFSEDEDLVQLRHNLGRRWPQIEQNLRH